MNSAHSFALLALFVAWVDSFSWDVMVVDGRNSLQFFKNGTLTHTEDIPTPNHIYSITYDPVHYRLLFADYSPKKKISSFDLTTRNIQPLVTIPSDYYLKFTYDPVTQLLFWLEGVPNRIYSFSLNPASSNEATNGKLIVTFDHFCGDIVVDSCGRYIYWATEKEIERARFDGSEREVLVNSTVWWRYSLAIDQQTQTMYWTERIRFNDKQVSIGSADLNGQNLRTLYTVKNETLAGALTVSNDFIYWLGFDQKRIWQLPKNNSQQLEAKPFSFSYNYFSYFRIIEANYTIKDQLKGNPNCDTLKSLIPKESEPDCINCLNGGKVSGESRCECTQGYTGGRCDVYVCHNYCLEGNCSVNAEGQPICSCKAGFSGERCELNACHGYCLNSGICSLDEEHHPVCQCTAEYDGERCAVPAVTIKCMQTVSMLKDMLNADPVDTLNKGVKSACASTIV